MGSVLRDRYDLAAFRQRAGAEGTGWIRSACGEGLWCGDRTGGNRKCKGKRTEQWHHQCGFLLWGGGDRRAGTGEPEEGKCGCGRPGSAQEGMRCRPPGYGGADGAGEDRVCEL